jgi:hypothetical protein
MLENKPTNAQNSLELKRGLIYIKPYMFRALHVDL